MVMKNDGKGGGDGGRQGMCGGGGEAVGVWEDGGCNDIECNWW